MSVLTAMDLSKSDPDGIFIGENGICLCGQHLGARARFTGIDLDGYPVYRVKPTDEEKDVYQCEQCGKGVTT